MGKKKRKGHTSLLKDSTLYFSADDGDSTQSFLSFSNISLKDRTAIPEKFIVSKVEFSGCESYAKHLKSDWENIIFLHPSMMIAYNIKDLVLVEGEQNKALCVAYPLEHIKKSLVVFPKNICNFQFQELVSLQPYQGKVREAEEIFISVCSEKASIDPNVMKLVLNLLFNVFIYEGLSVKWKLFDQEFECIVRNITYSSDIANFSLNETSDCRASFYTVSYKTVLKFETQTVPNEYKTSQFVHIGGLEHQLKKIKKYIQVFLNSEGFAFYGMVIFQGPSGTGKSLLLNAISKEYNICIQHIQWYKICAMSQTVIKRELRNIFTTAVDNVPSIIIIDEFSDLCPSKDSSESVHQCIKQILKHLLETLDDVKVMIFAATSDSDFDESAFQTQKRLIEVIKFPIPSVAERVDILRKLLDLKNHKLTSEQIQECAELAHGFTGKDLLNIIKDAQIISCKRKYYGSSDENKSFNTIINEDINVDPVEYLDLKFTLKLKKPSIIAASDLKVKKVRWDDIGGMTEVKEKLKQLVEWPLKYPEVFKLFNITPSHGVLMYGPPGCSKTMIAKALATECELNFISKNASDLYDKYVGESERAIRDLFAMAKAKSPCIIFLDEIDALVIERGSSSGSSGVGDRIVTTLLTEIDGIEELRGIIIIAATNRPDMLDDALVRNERINHYIYVPLPDATTREEILRISMRNRTVSEDFDFNLLSEKTEGYSGAEIVNICNEAALQLLAEDSKAETPTFCIHHFEEAIQQVHPRTSKEMMKFYENFNQVYCTKYMLL